MSEHEIDDELDGPPPFAPGEPVAPGYPVVELLRRGEDLDVYDVWSVERECRCVAKTLRPDRIEKATARARLLREGRLLLSLTHPHIVRAYELQRGERPVLVLETLPGETLAHLIERETDLGPAEIAHLGLHLCSAIGYMHRKGILHLDLKPSNIVAASGLARVLDLSVARKPGRAPAGNGTVGYAAPEQERGGVLGPPADVWGIGVVLYEAATGEPAVDPGGDETETGSKSPYEFVPPLPVRSHRQLPSSLAAIIDDCLLEDPAARPSLAALAQELARFTA